MLSKINIDFPIDYYRLFDILGSIHREPPLPAKMQPLPSLLRASAWDAGNFSAAKAGRKVWSRKDYNAAADTQDRLVRACYGRPYDRAGSKLPYIRFQIAEQYERSGEFTLSSDFDAICDAIDASLIASVGIPLTH